MGFSRIYRRFKERETYRLLSTGRRMVEGASVTHCESDSGKGRLFHHFFFSNMGSF